ncbi:hypothetical protein, partial [Serratia marcescens]|uniref:hypothetical protein n=1 Tax=Serratia marcescens TaxID=615 RepID=UPI00235EA4D9
MAGAQADGVAIDMAAGSMTAAMGVGQRRKIPAPWQSHSAAGQVRRERARRPAGRSGDDRWLSWRLASDATRRR